MQSNSPFSTPPPIPTPDGNFSPVQKLKLPMDRSDWQTAPAIVKSWAFVIARWGTYGFPLVIFLSLYALNKRGHMLHMSATGTYVWIGLYALLFAADLWLLNNFKKGTPAAWTVQIVLSFCILLNSLRTILSPVSTHWLGFLGLAIHIYILSQWFKPETKAWFGCDVGAQHAAPLQTDHRPLNTND